MAEQKWFLRLPLPGRKDGYKEVLLDDAENEEHALAICGYSKYGVTAVDFDSTGAVDSYDDTGDFDDDKPIEPAVSKPVFVQKYNGTVDSVCNLPSSFDKKAGTKITSVSQLGATKTMPGTTDSPAAATAEGQPGNKFPLRNGVKDMLADDIKDGALRASSRQATKFVRKLLLDKALPKIDNVLFRAGATSFLESRWGETAIKLVGGYGYALVQSRIPLKAESRAYANVISEHLRRDGVSNMFEELADAVVGPVREFISSELANMSQEEVAHILEKDRIRVAQENATVALPDATAAEVEELLKTQVRKPRATAASR